MSQYKLLSNEMVLDQIIMAERAIREIIDSGDREMAATRLYYLKREAVNRRIRKA